MRKLLFALILLSVPALLWAAFGVDTVSGPEAVDTVSSPAYVDGVEGTVACTQQETYGTTCNDDVPTGHSVVDRQKMGFQFETGGSGFTLTKLNVWLNYNPDGDNDPEGTVTPYICTDSSDEPACANAGCTACTAGTPVAVDNFPSGTKDWQPFIFPSIALAANTKYWLVASSSEYGLDEKVQYCWDNVGEDKDVEKTTDSAATWLQQETTVQIMMVSYYGDC